MKKFALAAFVLAVFCCYQARAKVIFLPQSDESIGSARNATNQSCEDSGYTYTTCAGALVNPCPDDNHYYKICCPPGYLHERKLCGANVSIDNCYGYYRCEVNEGSVQSECMSLGYTTIASENSCPSVGGITYSIEKCPYSNKYIKCVQNN
ncbi:MAG TPA: hypothetical protein DIC64_00255 [Alphaproteobacteria bacterium]|nr:hypothetical protein [Alphaproteobacteria bacterium]